MAACWAVAHSTGSRGCQKPPPLLRGRFVTASRACHLSAAETLSTHVLTLFTSSLFHNIHPPCPPAPPSGGHVERRAHSLNLQTEASACCSGALHPGTPATRSGNVAVQPVPVEDGCQSSSTQVGAGPRLKLVLDQCQHSIFDDNQAGMLTAWLAGRLAGGRLKARWTQGSLRVLLKS